MTEIKFTKGPWTILPEEVDKPYIRIRGTHIGGRWKIANVLTPVYDNVHPREAEETRANTSLIAAAPELYEALKEARDCVAECANYESSDKRRPDRMQSTLKILTMVDMAIGKAEGRS